MKVIAFYLPQFHEIPENSKWWGQGFTEWVNVKKARPLFKTHYQPRIPIDDNYYNLLDSTVMEKQMKMAKEYGIDGFCFYHYWFNGKLVLQRPVENVLENKKAFLPFCFAWANEAWTKTWHGAKGSKEVLIRQCYGDLKDWEKHYDYLNKFFRDDRYIKIDNRPVLLIYKINNMRHRSEMFEYFNDRAKQEGFDGIYLIQMLSDEQPPSKLRWISATVDFEPAHTRNIIRKERQSKENWKFKLIDKHPKWNWWNRWMCDVIDYCKFNEELLKIPHKKNQYRCSFVDYDDSPRRGKKAMIFKNSTPKKFAKYLKEQMKMSISEGKNIVFINAWNEWGESNYLEPDKKNGYKYLEMIRSVKNEIRE